MKKLFLSLLVLAVVIAACANPAAIELTPTVIPPTPIPADLPPAVRAVIEVLAQTLGVEASQITLVNVEAVDWPDACLGAVRMGVMCVQVITPGYRIVLEADGQQYEYHTNADGSGFAAVWGGAGNVSEDLQRAAREALAQILGLDPATITVASATLVEWPDSCLGVAQSGMVCLEAITPGALLVLKANDMTYEYHTNADGSVILPATVALTWHREGGIAGFCDNLVIYLAGEVHASTCAGNVTSGTLSVDELAQLQQWLRAFSPVTLDKSDAPPGSADAMTIALTLNGIGAVEAAETDQQTLTAWAQSVYVRVTTGAVES